jgi:hypothetical protein
MPLGRPLVPHGAARPRHILLWLLTLPGIPRVQGVELAPLIIFMTMVGTSVHVVSNRKS